jgi:hypothetical protein
LKRFIYQAPIKCKRKENTNLAVHARVTRRVFEIIAQDVAQTIFAKIAAQTFGLLLQFDKICSKVKNRLAACPRTEQKIPGSNPARM